MEHGGKNLRGACNKAKSFVLQRILEVQGIGGGCPEGFMGCSLEWSLDVHRQVRKCSYSGHQGLQIVLEIELYLDTRD
jgi:hypothetical protein